MSKKVNPYKACIYGLCRDFLDGVGYDLGTKILTIWRTMLSWEFVYCVVDTVKSSRDSPKTLLTLFFTREKPFPAFLINRCTKGSARLVFDNLEKEWEPMNLIFKVFLQYL